MYIFLNKSIRILSKSLNTILQKRLTSQYYLSSVLYSRQLEITRWNFYYMKSIHELDKILYQQRQNDQLLKIREFKTSNIRSMYAISAHVNLETRGVHFPPFSSERFVYTCRDVCKALFRTYLTWITLVLELKWQQQCSETASVY